MNMNISVRSLKSSILMVYKSFLELNRFPNRTLMQYDTNFNWSLLN